MTEEFRDDVKAAIRRHDPAPKDLRDLADDLRTLAEKFEEMEVTI